MSRVPRMPEVGPLGGRCEPIARRNVSLFFSPRRVNLTLPFHVVSFVPSFFSRRSEIILGTIVYPVIQKRFHAFVLILRRTASNVEYEDWIDILSLLLEIKYLEYSWREVCQSSRHELYTLGGLVVRWSKFCVLRRSCLPSLPELGLRYFYSPGYLESFHLLFMIPC